MRITREVPDLQTATAIAASGFGVPESYDLEVDVFNHLGAGDLVYGFALAPQDNGWRETVDGRALHVGFAIFKVWGIILYLSGIIMDADHQRSKAVNMAVWAAVNQLHNEQGKEVAYLAFRTQSLPMWVAGSRETKSIFPREGVAKPVDELARIGARVAKELGSVFPVSVGHYGGPLYGKKPIYRGDRKLQLWWDGLCDFERGDAVICVGELRKTRWGHAGW